MKKKICLFDVTASHYRSEIFRLLDVSFDIDFFFGDMMTSIKTMDYNALRGFKKILHVRRLGPLFWYQNMIKIVASRYDICIFDGDYRCLSTWLSLVLCKIQNKRAYIWTHGFYGDESGVKLLLKKIFVSLASHSLIYGDYARNIMISKFGISPSKLTAIHNSLNYQLQKQIRSSLTETGVYSRHFENSYPVLIFIGRLEQVKKLEMIVEAQNILRSKDILINVVLVGDGSQRENLENLADYYKLTRNIWFYGSSYDERINAELIYNADICVSPGNIGLTAIHSLSYGTPAITHNNWRMQMPEFEVIIKDETGDYFEYNDVASLAYTIENWLRKNKARDEIRANCFRVIDESWNPNYQITKFKSLINDEC